MGARARDEGSHPLPRSDVEVEDVERADAGGHPDVRGRTVVAPAAGRAGVGGRVERSVLGQWPPVVGEVDRVRHRLMGTDDGDRKG